MNSLKTFFVVAAFTVVCSATQAFGQGYVIYNSIPAPLPGNLASQPFEAQQTREVGDRLQFAAGGRKLTKVTQTMSSWACQSGSWYEGDCMTTPGSTFTHPITLNIYSVGPGNSVGSLITSVTQSFAIPFRPSASLGCGDGRWYNAADATCYNGFATNIVFNLPAVTVPNQVIYGIAYNTTHYGYSPIGEATACFGTPQGCGYDSLNVALEGVATVGVDPAPDDAYWNTLIAGWYCDGGAGGSGVFRLDQGCWTGYKSSVRFTVAYPPANANDCKNGGWQIRTRLNGTTFKNQGDCIQYVNTGK